MKTTKIQSENIEKTKNRDVPHGNHENLEFPCDNNRNHWNLKIEFKNHANNENATIPRENNENQENHRIS